MKKIMFDTNIFDAILDGQIDLTQFSQDLTFYVTHIQRDEIEAINQPEKFERKEKLLKLFNAITQITIPTESAVYGISRYGEAKYSGEDNLIEVLRKENLNNTEDALIGETAINNNIILVTNDPDFMKRVKDLGGKAINFDQFIKREF